MERERWGGGTSHGEYGHKDQIMSDGIHRHVFDLMVLVLSAYAFRLLLILFLK